MARYMLQHMCFFVDAWDYDRGSRPPQAPTAQVVDKRGSSPTYMELSDDAAFIARFLVQGVDTGLIAQILVSDGMDPDQAPTDIDAVYKAIKHTLRPYEPKSHHPPNVSAPKPHKSYDLPFDVNPLGVGVIKGPT
jgi:hypothetical protein